MAETTYFRADVPPKQRRDVRELQELGRQLDVGKQTFPFEHARLAWLESNGDVDDGPAQTDR